MLALATFGDIVIMDTVKQANWPYHIVTPLSILTGVMRVCTQTDLLIIFTVLCTVDGEEWRNVMLELTDNSLTSW